MSAGPGFWKSLGEHWHHARTLRGLRIRFYPEKCKGVYQCYEVCPIGCWNPDRPNRKVIHYRDELCIACGACVLQCPEEAIELR